MTTYDQDVVAWANEQAALLRAGQFSALDLEHLADEIEDVGKSEQRELASRMAVLLAHLLKWQFQPARRGASWEVTIAGQRKEIAYELRKTPSLKVSLRDDEWIDIVWTKATVSATTETGISAFPSACPWTVDQILANDFWPENVTA